MIIITILIIEFVSRNGRCVPLGDVCDGQESCGDASDEQDCDRPLVPISQREGTTILRNASPPTKSYHSALLQGPNAPQLAAVDPYFQTKQNDLQSHKLTSSTNNEILTPYPNWNNETFHLPSQSAITEISAMQEYSSSSIISEGPNHNRNTSEMNIRDTDFEIYSPGYQSSNNVEIANISAYLLDDQGFANRSLHNLNNSFFETVSNSPLIVNNSFLFNLTAGKPPEFSTTFVDVSQFIHSPMLNEPIPLIKSTFDIELTSVRPDAFTPSSKQHDLESTREFFANGLIDGESDKHSVEQLKQQIVSSRNVSNSSVVDRKTKLKIQSPILLKVADSDARSTSLPRGWHLTARFMPSLQDFINQAEEDGPEVETNSRQDAQIFDRTINFQFKDNSESDDNTRVSLTSNTAEDNTSYRINTARNN